MNKDQIIFLIGRIQYKANKFLVREMSGQHISGLAPSHGEILGALIFQGALSMTEIAKIIGKDKSTITALVNKLIRLGYVEKRKHGTDNRFSLIAVTPKGEALKPIFIAIAGKLRARSYKDIPDEERETLARLLMKLNENL
jgi:MarR family transcriptional regulator, organic hydroperoxide resistance regulator